MRWRRWLLPAAAVLCVPVAIALVALRGRRAARRRRRRGGRRPLPGQARTAKRAVRGPGLPAGSRRREGGRARGRSPLSPRRLALRPRKPEQHDGVPHAHPGGAAGEPRAEAHRRQPGGDRSAPALAAAQPPRRRGDEPLRRRSGRPVRTPFARRSTRSRTRSRQTRTTPTRSSTSRSSCATSSTRSPRPLPPTAAGWAVASPASAATARATDGPHFSDTAGGDLRRVRAVATRHLLVSRAARGPDPERAEARGAFASLAGAARRRRRRRSRAAGHRGGAARARHRALGAGADGRRGVLRHGHVALDARLRRRRRRDTLRPVGRGGLGDPRPDPAGALGHRVDDRSPAPPRPADHRPPRVRDDAPALDRRRAAAAGIHVLHVCDVLRHPRRHPRAPVLLADGEEARARGDDRRRVAAVRLPARRRVPRQAADPDGDRSLRERRRAHLRDG